MVVGMQLRSPQATLRAADDPIGQLLMKTIRGPDREELFRTAEAIGNVRLDRLALGMTVDDNANSAQVVFRITGAADRKRIADFFGQVLPGAKVKQEKGPKGEPITLIEGGGKGRPSFALVGDSDLVLVAQADRGPADVLGQVLEVRAGKRKGVPDGKLARLTKEAPRNARTLVAYDLPEKALAKVFRGIAPLPAAPRDLLVYVTNADAAGKLKQEGLKALDNVPPREKVPPAIIKTMKDTLSALKIEARRGSVNGELTIANESALVDAFK